MGISKSSGTQNPKLQSGVWHAHKKTPKQKCNFSLFTCNCAQPAHADAAAHPTKLKESTHTTYYSEGLGAAVDTIFRTVFYFSLP
jgi:hypothetical protein